MRRGIGGRMLEEIMRSEENVTRVCQTIDKNMRLRLRPGNVY